MSDMTPRLDLPLLFAAQAQKEVTHNEALQRLDMCVQPVAQAVLNIPPSAPDIGACWLIGPDPEADWSGKADAIAQWTAGGWRFVQPFEGFQLWLRSTGTLWTFVANVWRDSLYGGSLRIDGKQVVGPQQPAIPSPSGGAAVDSEARAAIDAIIAALGAHGLISN